MKKDKLSFLKALLYFLGVTLITFIILNIFVSRPKSVKPVKRIPTEIEYTAIGDSITHGIGDTNKNEGFVGALKDRLQDEKHILVKSHNFGYTGKTSSEIKNHIFNDRKLRNNVKKAKIITLDMGGNDMIYTIQRNFFNLDKEKFNPLRKKFEVNLNDSLTEIKKLNPNADIIVLGIYNPFHLYFNDIKDFDSIFKEWNYSISEIVKSKSRTFYIDVDKLINGPTAKKKSDGKLVNRYLSEDDDVHPNGLGYSLIANELFKLINKYKLIR